LAGIGRAPRFGVVDKVGFADPKPIKQAARKMQGIVRAVGVG
jgi:hypothetical protein